MKHLHLPDGRNFAWRTSGNGAPLILIHGWGSSSPIFAQLMSKIPNYDCLAPDLPGYGASATAGRVDLDALVDDFIDWFDALELQPVHLLGWSLGGMIAQELAARFPGRIEKLVLIATTPRFTSTLDWPHGLADATVRALARDFKRAPTPTLVNFWSLQFQGDSVFPAPMISNVELPTALSGLELLRRADLRNQLCKITMPTLVLHGINDVIIPLGAGRYLANSLPQAHLLEIKGRGHAPFYSDAETVSAAILQFLS